VKGVVHTTWGRSCSLRQVYGPWEGWLPVFLAAGDPERWAAHPFGEVVPLLDTVVSGPTDPNVAEFREAAAAVKPGNRFEEEALRWWELAVKYEELRHGIPNMALMHPGYAVVRRHVGLTPGLTAESREQRRWLSSRLDTWEEEVRAFWQDAELTDVEEYLGSRLDGLRAMLTLPEFAV
jgi:hypothetical protein